MAAFNVSFFSVAGTPAQRALDRVERLVSTLTQMGSVEGCEINRKGLPTLIDCRNEFIAQIQASSSQTPASPVGGFSDFKKAAAQLRTPGSEEPKVGVEQEQSSSIGLRS